MKQITLLLLLISIGLFGCDSNGKRYEIGECLIPNKSSDVTSIIKIVSSSQNEYKVFTHFLSGGNLILAEDYTTKEKSEVNKNYSSVQCPSVDRTFSPDKYLNEREKN